MAEEEQYQKVANRKDLKEVGLLSGLNLTVNQLSRLW